MYISCMLVSSSLAWLLMPLPFQEELIIRNCDASECLHDRIHLPGSCACVQT